MNAKADVKTLQHFIAGQWVDAEKAATFEDLNPLDDSLYAHVAKGTGNDMRKAIGAAKDAFASYRQTTPTQRERWLLRVAELMEERQQELISCLVDEIGSTFGKAMFEFGKGLAMVRAAAGMCRNVRGETFPSDVPGKFSMSIRAPLGVVAVITPFNGPLIVSTTSKVSPSASTEPILTVIGVLRTVETIKVSNSFPFLSTITNSSGTGITSIIRTVVSQAPKTSQTVTFVVSCPL